MKINIKLDFGLFFSHVERVQSIELSNAQRRGAL